MAALCSHLVECGLSGQDAIYHIRFAYMVDDIVDAWEPRGRVEIQVGAGRRRWSDEVEGRIVAESYALGAVVSEVARRHGISPSRKLP
jgi:Transposase